MFEPSNSKDLTACVTQAISWASSKTNSKGKKMIRLYTHLQEFIPILDRLLGRKRPSQTAFVESSSATSDSLKLSNVERTVALLPNDVCVRTVDSERTTIPMDPLSGDDRNFQWTHQLISALMLTDAMRKSGF